ncbi:phage major tail tube protein [Hyphomicrobium sulfonivorans]|uniref:phage major tail tube protein n=1 Tax=Hyphomicrobium sulfonivorans TaxID=121290 RepID=UPI001571090C|nr:phage major tail tube protein [Hyphomicrobium sulfonivorans]MBI1649883.1 phage major tail tube protein [Hyphomicrobium sulfonivorans]NSL71794.1 phage tail protein [Hyphomicrobium sulfonivorans]
MSTLYIVEAANLFCGDHEVENSKHLAIQELKLPPLQAKYSDHHAGGARVEIEVEVGIQKLEPTFKLVGFDPALLTQFGLGTKIKNIYTAYGEVLDRRTGQSVELIAKIEGRLGKVEGDAFQRGELMAHEYAINEVTHYEIHFNGQEKIYWDFWRSQWRVGGVDQNAVSNSLLRIPRTA